MLGLQKAFDTVDHVFLCRKLKVMGIRSVAWFMSYLSNRSQVIHVNKTYSESFACNLWCSSRKYFGSPSIPMLCK